MNFPALWATSCLILLLPWSTETAQQRLNEYISHFESLSYDTNTLHSNHQRAKRSTNDRYVRLDFSAHGRHFNLRLRRDTTTFIQNPELELRDGAVSELDTSHIYEGDIYGEKGSRVHGSIINGIFSGVIRTSKENYHVEKSELYFSEPQGFHSVIYGEKDMVLDPHRSKRSLDSAHCGAADSSVHTWMKDVQNSAVEDDATVKMTMPNEETMKKRENINLYGKDQKHKVYRRATDSRLKRTCTLFLQSDPLLWNYMTKDKKQDGLGYTASRAKEEITSLFASHVNGIKSIYEETRFQYGDMDYSGFSFVVRRVKIQTMEDCDSSNSAQNRFCKTNIDVSNFLNQNSLNNHNLYCLAYVFTYRDFTGGTLGLAWVGSPTKSSGGICERWKEYTENGRKIYKSLNTGIVTLVNYGSRVPPKVSTLTFAHEVGHNFGSPHDSGAQCVPTNIDPNAADGNFIMFASATSGDRPNNSKFSSCSIGNITQVLDAVLKTLHSKTNCFVESEEAFCGNSIVEEGEQCDCGFDAECNKTDNCCFPQESATKCQLKDKVQCSPSQGPCCTNACEKIKASDMTICQQESECSGDSYCNGINATCPVPTPKTNLTACNDNTQVCVNGECRGSICQIKHWDQCYVTPPDNDKSFDKGTLCFVACENPTTKECVSTGDEEALQMPQNKDLQDLLNTITQESIKLPPGAPCDNFQGYCDVFQKCRGVDADGPLARLKNLLFNPRTFNEIRDWIISHWWAVLIIGLGLVVFMGIFIKVCAVHTPSSNPKKPPARKISLRPQPRRHQGPPPAYVGPSRGGPPHGKGKGRGATNPEANPPPYNKYEMQPPRA